MLLKRGDILLAYYPFASGSGGSRRPALVVQNDRDNQRMANTVVAQITSNLIPGRRADAIAHPRGDSSRPTIRLAS